MKNAILHNYTPYLAAVAVGCVLAGSVLIPQAHALVTSQLDVGDSGDEVTELQAYLATDPVLYPEGLVTGYFGPLTQAAVERFQCRHDIVCSGSPATTGYGRVGPETLSVLASVMGGVGGPVYDEHAPIMSEDVVTTTDTTATISWTTNESAYSRVMYNTTFPFLYATAPSVSAGTIGVGHSVAITGLVPNTTYYYVRESVDNNGNVMWTTAHTFTTK